VLGPETRLVHGDPADGKRVEGAQQSGQVDGLENRHAVQTKLMLAGFTTLNVNVRHRITHADAHQVVEAADDVLRQASQCTLHAAGHPQSVVHVDRIESTRILDNDG